MLDEFNNCKAINVLYVCVMVLTAFQSVTVNAKAQNEEDEFTDPTTGTDKILGDVEIGTIILPRSVALQSQLNYTFGDLTTRLSGTVLAGAKLYKTDTMNVTSSGSVVMIITIDLYTWQADQLLGNLTQGTHGNRVGDNVTVSGAEVYRLHLPVDVLKCVAAADVNNSDFGDSPQYIDIWNSLLDYFLAVVTLPLYVLTVCALTFAASLAKMVLSVGMYLLGTIASAISATVAAAERAVVDAFNAFVAWAATFITNTISNFVSTVFGPLVYKGLETGVDTLHNLANWIGSIRSGT
jgi:hypothetical protein